MTASIAKFIYSFVAKDAAIELQAVIACGLDEEGSIVYANRKAEELFGYGEDGMIGISIDSLVPERSRAGHKKFRLDFMKKPRARAMGVGVALRAVDKLGIEFPVQISLVPVPANGVLSHSIVLAYILPLSTPLIQTEGGSL